MCYILRFVIPFKRPAPILLILLLILAPAGCQRQPAPLVRARFLLDTLVTIKSYDVDRLKRSTLDAAVNPAFGRMKTVERRLNVYDKKSETAKLNRLAGRGDALKVSADMWMALDASKQVAKLTGGAFNPAIGPVTRIWRFGAGRRVPPNDELRRALEAVRPDKIIMDSEAHTVRLGLRGMLLDLGGIAKGVAVDRAAEVLRRRGLKHTLVTSTSSTKALGPKPGGQPWLIGIESPRPKRRPGLIGVIELRRGSISTSGDYQRFFIKHGRRYHHILDPKTGYPAGGFMSVTVVTTHSAAFADALSTGLAVMGRRRAMALVEKLPGTGAVFVDGAGKTWVSAGLKNKLHELVKRVK